MGHLIPAFSHQGSRSFRQADVSTPDEQLAHRISYEAKLIIELDGGHHNEPAGQAKDRERMDWLEEEGFRVIRFWNPDVFSNLEGVLAQIQGELGATGHSP